MFISLVTAAHIIIALFLIVVVLLQQGRGADMGATFGGGSQSLFGAGGADTLLTRLTTYFAVGFMVTSVLLAANARNIGSTESDISRHMRENTNKSAPPTPAQPAPAPEAPQGAN